MRHLIRLLLLPVTITVASAGLAAFAPSTAGAAPATTQGRWPDRSRGDGGHRKHHRHQRARRASKHERRREAHARAEREGPKGEL
jgi:hypothetical protein